jgi:CSLREA domain-containing protein
MGFSRGMRGCLAGSLAASAVLALAASAGAATIAVNTSTDELDGVPNATCSLREAIATANTNTDTGGCTLVGVPGTDTINLPSTGTIDLTTVGTALAITTPIDIVGPGPNLIVTNTNNSSRIFSVAGSTTVHISGIDISSGNQSGTGTQQGGAIANGGTLTLQNVNITASQVSATDTANAAAQGGSIYNQGTLTLDTSSIKNSHATATETGNPAVSNTTSADGGAIYSTGPLTLTKSTIDDSHAFATKLSGAEDSTSRGGGIYATGTLSIDHSTISNNTAAAHADNPFAIVLGGGIYTTGTTAIELSTITANKTDPTVVTGTAQQAGGGVYSQAPGIALRSDTVVSNGPVTGTNSSGSNLKLSGSSGTAKNTILALPLQPGDTCSLTGSTLTSLGYNDEFSFTGGSNSCGFTFTGDIQVSPGLSPLTQANGGPTATMLPGGGSGVIDKGSSAGATDATHDQRGLSRPDEFSDITDGPSGDGTDIGAAEVQIAPPTFTAATPASPSSVDTPAITGVAPASSTVKLYTDAACAGAQTGPTTSNTLFATPGTTASPVAHNSTTTFYGTVTTSVGTSLCSSGSFPNTIAYTQADLPGSGGPTVTPPTGQRAAALKKCKKKKGKARKKCKKKARKLPV